MAQQVKINSTSKISKEISKEISNKLEKLIKHELDLEREKSKYFIAKIHLYRNTLSGHEKSRFDKHFRLEGVSKVNTLR